MNRIRAITLDLDNTLWAIDPVIRAAEALLWDWLGDNFPKIQAQFSADDMLELRRDVMKLNAEMSHDLRFLRKEVLARVAVESGYDAEDLVEPAFGVFDDARNAVELYPDVLSELESLFEKFTIVAVTNGNADLGKIGIRHLFHGVVTAVDAGAAKPARPIFDAAVSAAGVGPDEVLHVGDHPEIDIDGARRAGLRTAWINRKGDDWPAHLEPPDAVVTTISELRELLDPES
jgi:putative hydrolase of the HAD superfamily